MGQNLNLELPSWAEKTDSTICVKSPQEMYYNGKEKDENFPKLILACCGECGSEIYFHYKGLDKFISEFLGMNKYVEGSMKISEYTRTNDLPKTISIDFEDEKTLNAWNSFPGKFLEAKRYKENLVKDLRYKLHFSHNSLIVDMVITNDKTVLLYKLSKELGHDVPIISKPKSYNELLGFVYHFSEDFDIDGIKTGGELSNKKIFEVLFAWVETLFFLNREKLHKDKLNLWVEKC